MTTHSLNHVNLRAPRALLDALKYFYCDVVGLHPGFRPAFPAFGYWLYAQDSALIHLYEANPDEKLQTNVATTLNHFAFDCSNLVEVEETLKRQAVTYRKAIVPLTRQVQLFIQDPGGNNVELNFAVTDA
ncbi:MAG: diguanylate cyclase [Undibacterium sp.]|nr:diguanylate cyclase [Undibacterium sp.]